METTNQPRPRRGSTAMMNPHLISMRGRRDSGSSMPLPESPTIGGPPLMFASRARSTSQASSLEELRIFRTMAPRARAMSVSSAESPFDNSPTQNYRYPSVDEERILKGEFAI